MDCLLQEREEGNRLLLRRRVSRKKHTVLLSFAPRISSVLSSRDSPSQQLRFFHFRQCGFTSSSTSTCHTSSLFTGSLTLYPMETHMDPTVVFLNN